MFFEFLIPDGTRRKHKKLPKEHDISTYKGFILHTKLEILVFGYSSVILIKLALISNNYKASSMIISYKNPWMLDFHSQVFLNFFLLFHSTFS
jgi:hypothetical protein